MDSDLWISRLAAAKRHYAIQNQQTSNSSDRLSFDEFEMEEEIRPDFPCPYCYEDHDIASLCAHLEEEHPFESKPAVCTICSVKVTKDMLNHIISQHGHLLKLQRRRRLRRFAIPSSQTLSLLGRDLREAHLQVLLGSGGSRSSNNNISNIAADPFLSSLVLNLSASEADESSKPSKPTEEDSYGRKETALPIWKSSIDSSLTFEEREQRRKQATDRATFLQVILLSTLFDDRSLNKLEK